jgi:hypothetical protein
MTGTIFHDHDLVDGRRRETDHRPPTGPELRHVSADRNAGEHIMPLTTEQRRRNEASIRAAMDRLLLGQLPARGGCDLKTLAREAGVARTGFYARTDPQGNQRPGPYQHLAEEFQRRLADLREAGIVSDPRELQITRLKAENARLRERVRERDARITELIEFKERALSQLAAQHEEILRLRQRADSPNNVRTLPTARKSRITGPCG